MKFIAFNVIIIMAGFVAGLNAATMSTGQPEHYEAGWGNILIAVLLGLFFGQLARRTAAKEKYETCNRKSIS